VSEKDCGQSDAINRGFQKSKGGILAWLNSDDIYLPGTLMVVGEFFKNHPDVDVLYGDTIQIDSDDNILKIVKDIPFNKNAFVYWGNDISQSSAFFRSDIFFNICMLREKLHYGMDYDLWFRFVKSGAKFWHIPKILSGARIHARAKTISASPYVHNITLKIKSEILGVKEQSFDYKCIYFFFRLRRFILFIIQGDIHYVVYSLINRLKKIFHLPL